jgi:pyridoxal phosphate enzyme (YggS family)
MVAQTIAERVERLQSLIDAACLRSGRAPEAVTLVAVTKGIRPDAIRQAVAAGITHLAENRVQEAEAKRSALADIEAGVTWHMVGHLQTNKVKTAIRLFDIIQSVDSFHLAEVISRRATKAIPVFLEVNVAAEPNKYGFALDELPRHHEKISRLENIDIRGLMTVAPQAHDPEAMRPMFRRLRNAAESLGLPELSMGMSDDFEVAVEEGATHVRIGRAIFGEPG